MKGAPKSNQFWKLRTKHGRDRIFSTPELLEEACYEYFNWVDNNPWYKVEQLKRPITTTTKGGRTKTITTTTIPTARPYTLRGLCIYLNVNTEYLRQFEKSLIGREDEVSKEFSRIITHIGEVIYTQKFEGAAVGAFKENIIARELGLADKNELLGKDGENLELGRPAQIIIQAKKSDDELDIKENED